MLLFKSYLFITLCKTEECKDNRNNRLKIIAPKWDDEFELPNPFYSLSHTQNYIKCIIKNTKYYSLVLLFVFTSIGLIID